MTTTKLNTNQLNDYSFNNSLARQAIINGNFDVWQRGTSSTTAGGSYYTADRYGRYDSADGGTAPTVTTSRQAITPGALTNSFYCFRQAPNGAGTSLGANTEGSTFQKIEYGTRLLCGDGKKVTLSFWAKSDLASKKIGIWLGQNYGTGGSPTAQENINGTTFTLTSSWQKFTYTFTTNTLASKTFGTANDDYLILVFMIAWGSGFSTRLGGASAESWGGNGFIDIAQVQLCAGDVALPFMPKSFEEELRACQRYYERFSAISNYSMFAGVRAYSTTNFEGILPLKVTKRITPTGELSAANTFEAGGTCTSLSVDNQSTPNTVFLAGSLASGLTGGSYHNLKANNTTNAYIGVNAEL